jgi:hypothetical protein
MKVSMISPAIQQLTLWDLLETAQVQETEGDLSKIWSALEAEVAQREAIVAKLDVSAETIVQVAQVFLDRALLAFEQLDARVSRDGPEMPLDAFDRYVRQSMDVEFDDYIEPLESLPRKPPERSEPDSVVTEEMSLDDLFALIGEEPQEASQSGEDMVRALAGEDDPSTWIGAMRGALKDEPEGRSFLLVQREMNLALVEAWLGTLLGDVRMSQVGEGDFYAGDRLWVKL